MQRPAVVGDTSATDVPTAALMAGEPDPLRSTQSVGRGFLRVVAKAIVASDLDHATDGR